MIHAEKLHKEYRMGESVVHALAGVDLDIKAGEYLSITGASGSGKSTLMHIMGCLDRPTSGVLYFNEVPISALSEKDLARVRNEQIGFVFQTFNLVSRTSALDNVALPLIYTRKRVSKAKAMDALRRVGLDKRAKHTPAELSGGECQRVAIARAIVNHPQLILADEPTGNLDTRTGEQIMRIFQELNDSGITILLVTHEMDVAVHARRMIHMRDGHIIEDIPVTEEYRRQVLLATQGTAHRLLRHEDGSTENGDGQTGFTTAAPGRLLADGREPDGPEAPCADGTQTGRVSQGEPAGQAARGAGDR